MGESSIEWTDASWNPVRGCVKVSPGCKHCYAETFAERWRGVKGHAYEQGFDLRIVPHKLGEPLTWRKPRRVFVNSMSDLFQEGVSDEYIAEVFGVMLKAWWHTFQVLTKRADRMAEWAQWARENSGKIYDGAQKHPCPLAMFRDVGGLPWAPGNVHLGVSVEDRKYGLPRIDILRAIPAAVRFLSIEPLLEDIGTIDLTGIGWVIVGGESGPGARPFSVTWARSIVDQCKAAGVPCFIKQLGANVRTRNDDNFTIDGEPDAWPDHIQAEDRIEENLNGHVDGYQGAPVRIRLRSSKGGDPSEWPEDLRVRQFPEVQQREEG